MVTRTYDLYCETILIGRIDQIDGDFPWTWGKLTYSSKFDQNHEENSLLIGFIKYSIKADKLLEKDEELWENYIKKEGKKYWSFEESSNWKLVDQDGEEHSIMIPNFHVENRVGWRWA